MYSSDLRSRERGRSHITSSPNSRTRTGTAVSAGVRDAVSRRNTESPTRRAIRSLLGRSLARCTTRTLRCAVCTVSRTMRGSSPRRIILPHRTRWSFGPPLVSGGVPTSGSVMSFPPVGACVRLFAVGPLAVGASRGRRGQRPDVTAVLVAAAGLFGVVGEPGRQRTAGRNELRIALDEEPCPGVAQARHLLGGVLVRGEAP